MPEPDYAIGAAKIFTLFFVTLGPIKLLGPFARATAAISDAELRALALRVTALAATIAIGGGFVGRALLESWQIPVFVLRLTAGLILFVVAFRLVMQPYEAVASSSVSSPAGSGPRPASSSFPWCSRRTASPP